MKKTSFTQLRTAVSKHLAWLAFVCLTLCSLSVGAQTPPPFPVCGDGSVTPASPGSPVVDSNCDHLTPDIATAATVVPPTGFMEVGRVQSPNAGNPPAEPGLGPHKIYLTVIFSGPGGPGNLCYLIDSVMYDAVDNIPPMGGNCTQVMGGVLIDIDPNGPCAITLDEDFLRANMFNPGAPTDNCTASDDLVVQSSVPTIGPLGCAGPNPDTYNFIIRVTDLSGNMQDCNTSIELRDVSGPIVTFDSTFGGGSNFMFEVPMTLGCGGDIPDMTSAVTSIMDNCDPGASISQFPLAGSNALGVVLTDPATGCLVMQQPVTVSVTDCFGNATSQEYLVTYRDETPAQFNDPSQVCALANNDPDYPAGPLVADSNCMVIIPDLSDGGPLAGNLNDNCNTPSVIQDPPPGLYDVSGICPPNNTIDVTFTPVDCDGNAGTPVTCPAFLSFTDVIPPTIVCPADPITVVVPFDGATCEIGMAMVDLALLLAQGVTVTDNCDPMPALTSVSPNMFTCSDIGKAGLTVTIDAEDCFGNPAATTTCAVEVVPDSDLTALWSIGGGDFIVCPDEFPVDIVLGPETPSCGVWSGDVAVSGAGPFTLEAASFPDNDGDGNPDQGSYSVTYTVGPVGCHAEITHNIMVSPEFDSTDAALVDDFAICLEMGETFDLEGLLAPGSIQGGTYTIVLSGATGTQIGNLFQYSGGDGTLTVTYLLEDCDADMETDEVIVTISEKPDGHFTMAADMCQDEGNETPNITGVPAGATVAFASNPVGFVIDGTTGEFDPSAGPLAAEFVDVLVTMTVSNDNCPDFTITQIVRVYESGDPAFDIPTEICESAAPLDLLLTNPNNDGGANPVTDANVTWTGTSVGDLGATGTFDPSVGPGVYTICVTVGAPSCEEQECHDITVLPDYTDDDVALIDNFSVCAVNDEVVAFSSLLDVTALPGGVWSGSISVSGTLTGTINPNSFEYNGGCGVLTVSYSFPDDCDVPTEDVVSITFEQKPDVGGLVLGGPYCATDGEVFIDYSGTPDICGTLGVFSGAGVTDLGTGTTALFNPATAGESADFTEHEITYTLASPSGICADVVAVGVIRVDAASPTDFTLQSEACANEVVALALDAADASVLPTSPDGVTEVYWFGGDGLNAIVTDNGDGTGTFVGYVSGTYNVCVRTGDTNCSQFECQQITVDITPPVLDCADFVRTRANDAGLCTFTMPGIGFDVTATDNCSPPNALPVLTHNYAPWIGSNANSLAGATFPVGITQVTWTATDTAGNSSSCTIEIVINDTEGPTVQSCPVDDTQGTDADICGANYTYAIPQFADNCDGTDLEGVLISGYAPGTDFPVGVTTVTWTYTDLANNSTATCSFTVTINDDDAPTPVCTATFDVVLDGDGLANYLADDVDLGSYDNCEIVSRLISRDGGVTFDDSWLVSCNDIDPALGFGIVPTILRVEDAAGNTAECTTDIYVYDVEVPDIECPGDYTVIADPTTCSAVVTYPAPTVTDNCSFTVTQLTTFGGPAEGTQEVPANDSPATGTVSATLDVDNNLHLVVWYANLTVPSVAAHIHNGAAGANGPVIVNLAPLGFPIGQTGGMFNATIALDAAQAAEFLAGNLYVNIHTSNFPGGEIRGQLLSQGLTSGDMFAVGTTVQTYQVEDIAGNIETCSFTITVYDEVAPTIDCGPTVRTRSADLGMCSFTMPGTGFDAVGMDNCDNSTITHNYPFAVDPNTLAGTSFPVGSTTVTWIATDASGNQSAICGIEIVVTDDENPTIDCGVSGGSANALVNPSFEAGGPFNTQGADGWTQFGPVFRLFESVNPMAFNAYDGDVFLKMFDLNAGLFQDVAVSPGQELDASVWILNRATDEIAADQEGFLKLEFLSGGVVVSELESTRLGSTLPVGVWTEVSLNATVPAGVDAVRFVVIAVKAAGGPGAVHFDFASLSISAPAPSSVLLNPSFEAGNPNNDSPGAQTDNWSTFGAVFRLNNPPGYASDGNFFLKTFGGASGMFQDFPVTAGDEVFGSADLQNASFDPTGPGQFGLVKFEFLDGGGVELSEVEGPQFFAGDLPTNVWTQATVSAVVPAGAVTARFVVVSVSPGGGAVMMDNASATIGSTPVIGDVSVSNDPGECGAEIAIDNPMASDNCGIVSIINDYNYTSNASDFYPVGTTVVGFTVTDASGNTADCTITVEVEDNENPVFVNCPTTMVMVGNDVDECSGKLNWSIPVATDNCEILSVTQTAGPINGTEVPVGMPMSVTYTATDVHGNTQTCTFEVQVVDTQKPEFDADIVMPANVTVECNAVPAPFVLTNDDVNDNCTASADLVITFNQVSTQGANPNNCNFYNYTITRTWTVTDEAGNSRVHVQVITVQDTTAPVPTCQDATVTLDKNGVATFDPLTVIAGTTDNCAPFSALTVVANPTTFDCNDLGANAVTITITDPCGNAAVCNITVTVEEGPAPCVPEATLATSCLNNATTLNNGQFAEVITVTSLAMQTWTVTSSTGLFTANSPAPPFAPTPVANGTTLTAGTGADMINYRLNARFVEGIGYSATLTNNLGQTVTITNVAFYPTPVINNLDDELCISTPAFVPDVTDQFAGAGAYVSVQFFVDGVPVTQIDPAAIGYGQHLLTVIVDADGFTPSTYVNGVNVPGTAVNAAASRLDPGCIQEYSEFFLILETPTQVACNDLVQVTLEPGCSSVVTPDMVLEGTYPCFDDYSVHITLPNGVPLSPPNVVTGAHAGLTLPYTLQHPISGNACWGFIKVEDKTAPVVTCPSDVEILCTVDPDSIVFWLPPNHPCFPARDFFGNLVPTSGQLLYYGQPTAVDCSDWTWEYTDDYTVFNCAQNSGLIAIIQRTFVVTDEFGNQGTCIQTIERRRGEFSDIDFPADLDIACNDPILNTIAPGFAPQLLDELYDNQCGGNTQGWPEIEDYNLTTAGTGACGLGITYTDEIVNICAESYKVVRTWKVHDWCPAGGGAPTVNTHIQYIKIENIAPTISINCQMTDPATGFCILNATEPGNPPHVLCSAIYAPFAQIDGGCDNVVEVTVETPAGFTTNGGIIPSPGIPLGGPYDLIYRAEDQCGNITQFVLTVVVQDKTAPIAVCDEITAVNLSADGLALVSASVFDDGSYDGCCLDEFLVRRMVDNCGIPSDLDFGPNVTFCCADIGPDPIMVVFRAVDCNGNFNDCMVEVNVNDKIPPILVSCPANERRTCDWYADNLETQLANAADAAERTQILGQYFGFPEFVDNCQPELNPTVNINIDQCLEGTITRQWQAEDPSGNNSQTCTQTIFIDHVSDWVIEFPADVTVTCGSTVPDFGEPEIFFETCELVAVSFDDEVFTTVTDACYKIVRHWTVINWCVVGQEIDQEVVEQPENALGLPFPACDLDGDGDCDNRTFRDSWRSGTPANLRRPTAADATRSTDPDTDPDSDPWDGYIAYNQTIKVIDNVDPVFTNGCDIPDVCINDNTCAAAVNLPTPDVDECSISVTYQVTGDLGTGFGPFFNVAPGTYDVRYVAMDNCNNQTACETTVTVVDCKKPTPYCKNGLVIELMTVNPVMVDVWASDFDAGSFDNCPGDLQLSFSANVNETSRTYTCADVGQQTVQIWVTDAAGNQDFCETFVIIQANMGQCDDPQQQSAIAGLINTEEEEGVSDVNVQLSGTNQMSVMTDGDGMFSFNVATGGDYTVTPVKDDEPLNGVTTFDLVLITKHILGVQPLNTPYKLIAADANKSNSVTTFDLVQLRKLILFIDLDFPNNTSWRFVDKDHVFSNPANPWATTFPEVVSYNNIAANQLAADFVAVKIGDVNGSAQPNLTSGSTDDRNAVGSLVFNVDDMKLKAGDTYKVDFKAQDFDVQGYQFTLNYDRNALEFVEVVAAVAEAQNFGFALLDKGAITTSWNDDNVSVANGETVFSLVFKATTDVKLSNVLSANSRFTKAEAYQQDGELLDIQLAFNGAVTAGFELYQNTPNPFSSNTVIGFNLPEAGAATMTITDVSGRVVKVVEGDFAKGYNEIKLQRGEVNATGILYYQLDTDTDSATKMMLLID